MALRTLYNKFNRGEIDSRALARGDVEKVKDSASLIENFMPVRLGPMSFRPGMQYIDSVNNGGKAYCIPFVASIDNTALLEFTDSFLGIIINDVRLTSTSTTDTITNGAFTSNITGWTDNSDAGGSTAWVAGGFAAITGTGSALGSLYQTITVGTPNTKRSLRIVVARAPVYLKLGYSVGGTEIYEGMLAPGTHVLTFSPSGNFTIQFSNMEAYPTRIDSVAFEIGGAIRLPTPYVVGDLPKIRFCESVDVVFIACAGYMPMKIERRGIESWSFVQYLTNDGPFEGIGTLPVTFSAADYTGETTISASRAYFKSSHVGMLMKFVSTSGQTRVATGSALSVATLPVRVTGVGSARAVDYTRAGTGTSTMRLQSSPDGVTWTNVSGETRTTNGTSTYTDGFDNSIIYYRAIIEVYSSGTVTMTVAFASGSATGIVRVLAVGSSTSATVQVLQDIGSKDPVTNWYEGSWSAGRGYPSSCALFEGRLFWAGKNKIWGSVSDVFDSFDDGTLAPDGVSSSNLGASAAITRSIGFGPADSVNWLQPISRLLMGIVSDGITMGSTSFGEVLTNTNATLRSGSTQGCAPIDAIKADNRLYFVQRSNRKLFQITYDLNSDSTTSEDLNVLSPGICSSDIVRIAVTRQPETRVYAVLADGTARVFLHEPTEEARGWSRITTRLGTIEDVVVLPGTVEDQVYWVINNPVAGFRSLYKSAKESEAIGGTVSKHYDGFSTDVVSTDVVGGAGFSGLKGLDVACWVDGKKFGTATVTNTIPYRATFTGLSANAGKTYVVGLEYAAQYKSNKLIDYINASVFNENKRTVRMGLIAENIVPGAFLFGTEVSYLDPLPSYEKGRSVDPNVTVAEYDNVTFPMNGTYRSDSRVYFGTTAPATVLAVTVEIDDPTYRPSPSAQ